MPFFFDPGPDSILVECELCLVWKEDVVEGSCSACLAEFEEDTEKSGDNSDESNH